IAGLLFIVQLLCSPFSNKVADQIVQHPVIHAVWACFGAFSFYVLTVWFGPSSWPPRWWERRSQRKTVLEKVTLAGGWDAIHQGCEELLTTHTNVFVWYPPRKGVQMYLSPQTKPTNYYVTNIDYGPLPSAVAALTPREVTYYPPEVLAHKSRNAPTVPIVLIKIFGMHATGGHSQPYYALEVVCGPDAQTYSPKPGDGGISFSRPITYNKVSEGVYEVY